MKRIFIFSIVASLLLIVSKSFGQSYLDIRINEIQTFNTNGITDETGERSGWIELFNSAFGMIDVAGFYITDTEQTNVVKQPKGNVYQIPKGNPKSIIPLRGYLVLYADANSNKGPFHLNFTLDNVNHLYIYEPGGDLIDQVNVPQLGENESFGRKEDGAGSHEPLGVTQQSLRRKSIDSKIGADGGWGILRYPTPGLTNTTDEVKTKSQKMKEIDPNGLILFLTCFSVVFGALILLFLCFKGIGKQAMKNNPKLGNVDVNTHIDEAVQAGASFSAERYAAVALACYLYQEENEVHDQESDIITINKKYSKSTSWVLRDNNLQ